MKWKILTGLFLLLVLSVVSAATYSQADIDRMNPETHDFKIVSGEKVMDGKYLKTRFGWLTIQYNSLNYSEVRKEGYYYFEVEGRTIDDYDIWEEAIGQQIQDREANLLKDKQTENYTPAWFYQLLSRGERKFDPMTRNFKFAKGI